MGIKVGKMNLRAMSDPWCNHLTEFIVYQNDLSDLELDERLRFISARGLAIERIDYLNVSGISISDERVIWEYEFNNEQDALLFQLAFTQND